MAKHRGTMKVDNPFGWIEDKTDNRDNYEDNLLELASLLNEYLTPDMDEWDERPDHARRVSVARIKTFLADLELAMIEELDMLDPR